MTAESLPDKWYWVRLPLTRCHFHALSHPFDQFVSFHTHSSLPQGAGDLFYFSWGLTHPRPQLTLVARGLMPEIDALPTDPESRQGLVQPSWGFTNPPSWVFPGLGDSTKVLGVSTQFTHLICIIQHSHVKMRPALCVLTGYSLYRKVH